MSALHTHMREEGQVPTAVEPCNATGQQTTEPLRADVVDGELRIASRREGIRRAQAILAKYKQPGQGVVDEFIRERREEAQRE